MKGLDFKTADSKILHIPSFSKGLDLTDICHGADPEILTEAENVWVKRGVIESREGLCTDQSRLINNGEYSDALDINTFMTRTEIETDDGTKRLSAQLIEYDISAHFLRVLLLNADGSTYKSATQGFHRVSSDTFYIPKKVNLFKGKPQNGCGVYAMVYLINSENHNQTHAGIYELSADFEGFQYVSSSYVPTVLINGRGNKYEIAKQTGQAFTGTPTEIEGLNAINSEFHAYYSTDGRSSAFRLPFSSLSSKEVRCRLYYGVDTYAEWSIPENQSSSSSKLYGVEVTMNVNREKGIVSFSVPAGEYEVPMISERNENNLRITASKESGFTLQHIAKANSVINRDGKILAASGTEIFIADTKKPLYFPVESVADIGIPDGIITALAPLGKRVLAFTKGSIYSITVKSGELINATSLLADSDAVFYKADCLTVECASFDVGCQAEGSVINVGDRVFWCGSNRHFYRINSSLKIECISKKIEGLISSKYSDFNNPSAVRQRDKILFLWLNKALVLDNINESGEKVAWYYWCFPENVRVSGGFTHSDKAVLLCINNQESLPFMATLSGQKDTYLSGGFYETQIAENNILYKLRTGKLSLGCDNCFKKVDFVNLQLKGNNVNVLINSRIEAKITHLREDEFSLIRLTPGLCRINLLDVAFSGAAPFGLGSADLKYTALEL